MASMSFYEPSPHAVCTKAHLDTALEASSLRLRTCFLLHPTPNSTWSAPGHTRLRTFHTHQKRAYAVRPTRSPTFIVRCTQSDGGANSSELGGEIREMYERSLQETPTSEEDLQQSDRRVMDGITETGANRMNEIVSDMNEDLKGIQEEAAHRATKMIQEETDLLLEKYERKRLDILDQVKNDRQVIQEELTKLEGLAGDMKRGQHRDDKPVTVKILLASAMAFTVASLFYAWNGLVNSDASALSNAAVDIVVAAAAGYFASRRRTDVH